MLRPKRSDTVVVRRAAEAFAAELLEYDEIARMVREADLVGQLENCIALGSGFQIAKYLEAHARWHSITLLIVEALERASSHLYDAYHQACCEWVKLMNVRPKLAVGDKVVFRKSAWSPEPEVAGEITAMQTDSGMYEVHGEALPGTNARPCRVLTFEELEAANESN